VEGVIAPNHCWYQKTRLFLLAHNKDRVILCSFVWIGYQRVTDGQTDRRTDGRTERRNCCRYYSALHCMQCGRAVKITHGAKSGRGLGLGKLRENWDSSLILLQRPRCPLSFIGASFCNYCVQCLWLWCLPWIKWRRPRAFAPRHLVPDKWRPVNCRVNRLNCPQRQNVPAYDSPGVAYMWRALNIFFQVVLHLSKVYTRYYLVYRHTFGAVMNYGILNVAFALNQWLLKQNVDPEQTVKSTICHESSSAHKG